MNAGASGSSAIQGAILDDGRLLLLLPEDAAELTLTFQKDGCKAAEIPLDWNKYRTGELEVRFNGQ